MRKLEELLLSPIEHLTELRKRLIIIAVVILIGASVSFAYMDIIIELLLDPVQELDFIYLTPPELFLSYIKIALIVGVIVTSPIIFSQIWIFVKPGLEKKEKTYLVFSLFSGFFLFLLGAYFAYRIIIPLSIRFFVKFSMPSMNIEPNFSFGSYIGFISSILLSFGIVFELPILVTLLAKLNLITADTLRKYRKVSILVIFVGSAVFTPPDIISQLLLAGPMILLFEISILLAALVNRKKK